MGIYIYADPKNKREKDFNERMTEKAEAIRCRRFESIVNERYDFFDKAKMQGDFGATDKPCGEGARLLTQKLVAKRYMIAKNLLPLQHES